MFREDVRSAVQSLAGNRMRTMLSVTGIVIGVASVIAVGALGESASASITAEIAKSGLEIITASAGRRPDAKTLRLFDEDTLDDLLEIEGVKDALAVDQTRFSLRAGKQGATDTVIAASPSMRDIYSLELAQGDFLDDSDMDSAAQVVVLGDELAETLFPAGDALGSLVKFMGETPRVFRVVGVLAGKNATMGMDFDASAFVPRTSYLSRLAKPDRVGSFLLRADKTMDVMATSGRVSAYFEAKTGSESAVRVMSPSTIAETMTNVTDTLGIFLSGIAAISLLVGGIGIMNIMLVSVTERTREIGIRKALGATPGAIRAQFLTEAAFLTGAGGCLGVLFGLGTCLVVTNALGWTFTISPSSVGLALLVSAGTGVFFGLYPAARAAKLDPVSALAFE